MQSYVNILVRENQDWHARFGEKVGAEVKR